jgi:intracellular multiplication protein IcmP
MAAPGGGGGGGQEDVSMNFLWLLGSIMVAAVVIWLLFKPQLVTAYLYVKLYEAKFVALFSPLRMAPVQARITALLQAPGKIDVRTLILMGHMVGGWFRIPFGLIFLGFAVVVYLGNTTRVFRNIYNLASFAKAEAGNWPQISAVLPLNLIKQDIDKGPWAMALTPMQFAKRHRLIDEVVRQNLETVSWRDREITEAVLRKGAANQVFAMQLGPLWQGVDKLPPYTRALFAAFASRINAESKPAVDLFIQLARTCTTKLDYTGVDALIKKHYDTKLVQQIVHSHAYVYTMLASMLQGAREDGVQASADFLWLKPIDRRLWYILNTVGRQTPFVEVAGIFAHWTAEKETGKGLFVPMVDEATKALERALKDVLYRRDQ